MHQGAFVKRFYAPGCIIVEIAQKKAGVFVFYDRLKETCEKQGLKVTPVIIECGVSGGSIDKWKKGAIPSGKTLIALAKRLNVSTDYLLGLTEK